MKALTIKEPWATLIIDGYKKYEFRSWKTNYRGKILIHAGMSEEKDMLKKFKDYNLNCSKGMIIGEALLTDCILVTKEFEEELLKIDKTVYGRESHEMTYAWKLENIIKYDKPIPVKGKLGLWNYEEEIMHEMRLNNGPFELIKNGTKTIEIRLNDEKRRLLKEGDIIEFENRATKEKLKTKVIKLHKFDNFEELYKHFDKISLGYAEDEIAEPKDMEQYYPQDKQKQYGVLGIEIKVIK